MTLTFDENSIPFGMDHQFYRGIPSNIKFEVTKLSEDKIILTGPGYGGEPYGNGSIYVGLIQLSDDMRKRVLKELYDIEDEFKCILHPQGRCATKISGKACPVRLRAPNKNAFKIEGTPILNCPFTALQIYPQPKQTKPTLKETILHMLYNEKAETSEELAIKIIKLCGADPLKVVEG